MRRPGDPLIAFRVRRRFPRASRGDGAIRLSGLASTIAIPAAGWLTPYLDGVLIDFDFDRPQAKISPSPAGIIQIGPGLYIETFVLDHQAFDNCANLQG